VSFSFFFRERVSTSKFHVHPKSLVLPYTLPSTYTQWQQKHKLRLRASQTRSLAIRYVGYLVGVPVWNVHWHFLRGNLPKLDYLIWMLPRVSHSIQKGERVLMYSCLWCCSNKFGTKRNGQDGALCHFTNWIGKWILMIDPNEYWRSSHYQWRSYYPKAHGCLTSCCSNGELTPL